MIGNLNSALLLIFCFLITSCNIEVYTPESQVLDNTSWILESFEDVNGEILDSSFFIIKADSEKYSIEFLGNNQVSGRVSTTSFTGKYEIYEGDSIAIDSIQTVYVNLPDSSKFEKYLDALLTVSSYIISDNKLHMYYNQKNDILNFTSTDTSGNSVLYSAQSKNNFLIEPPLQHR